MDRLSLPTLHREFEAFVAGAAGRLLHVATLLTAEPPDAAPAARDLLAGALARTWVRWARLRDDDPYAHTRAELCAGFARSAWRHQRDRGGVLGRLAPAERLAVVLVVHEGLVEEQVAALLGLSADRVRQLVNRAGTALRAPRPGPAPAAGGVR
ncbi:sigma factor-like helix-turn-helix DNA-binding protein [Streptomyces sp. BI20]|uniref:sigma factor-like helix-turn-helix DNA-binding protein n=1 Tax=Streptomyces sp. BI20 TaxID=3403460 RepID=UPI003C70EF6E